MFTYEFVPHRGLNRSTLEFYDIRSKIDGEGKPVSVGFKYPNGSYKVRSLDQKEFRWEGPSEPGLFGRDKFSAGSHKYVTITEGEYDAASLYQTIRSPVVSVRSSTSAVADVSHDRSWLNGFERVYLAFDADAPGREAVRQVSRLFDYNKVLVLDFDRRKDANEYLQANEESELKQIWHNARRYLPEQIVAVNGDNVGELLGDKPKVGIPYPFAGLNRLLYGLHKQQSVLITAQEGVGKTEVMHAILHKILKETDDAVAAIFLEEPKGDLLRALAAIELQKPVHLPEFDIPESEVVSAINSVRKVDDRLHLYSHFGSDDPDVLLDTIRFAVTARDVSWVCLDHISMVVSGLAGDDERRALDYLSSRLEMLVKELNFGLIFVSHLNDIGQTRGSRYIGKVADRRIDISRDYMSPDDLTANTLNVSVSKARKFGKTGNAGSYLFDPYTRKYTELEAANDNLFPSEQNFSSAA